MSSPRSRLRRSQLFGVGLALGGSCKESFGGADVQVVAGETGEDMLVEVPDFLVAGGFVVLAG